MDTHMHTSTQAHAHTHLWVHTQVFSEQHTSQEPQYREARAQHTLLAHINTLEISQLTRAGLHQEVTLRTGSTEVAIANDTGVKRTVCYSGIV